MKNKNKKNKNNINCVLHLIHAHSDKAINLLIKYLFSIIEDHFCTFNEPINLILIFECY